MRLAAALLLVLALTACDKLRPPATQEVEGLLLTRTELDLWIISPLQSQVPGMLFVIGGDLSSPRTAQEAYALSLDDKSFTADFEIPLSRDYPRTLSEPKTVLVDMRSKRTSEQQTLLTLDLALHTRKESQLRNDPLHRLVNPVQYEGGLLLFDRDHKRRVASFVFVGTDKHEQVQIVTDYIAVLRAFTKGQLIISVIKEDGTSVWFEPTTSRIESGKHDPSAATWLTQATRPSGEIGVEGAFAGELIGARTANGIEFWNGEKVVTLEVRDPFITWPNGKSRPEIYANFLVDHPEELAEEGRDLSLDIHSSSAKVKPFDERRLLIFDNDYNRIVLVEPATERSL